MENERKETCGVKDDNRKKKAHIVLTLDHYAYVGMCSYVCVCVCVFVCECVLYR